MKVAASALSPLWEKGIRVLNYLEDWLILAHSWDLLCEHRDMVLRHLQLQTVAYVNHQSSRRMSQLTHHLLLWSQTQLKLLHAVYVLVELNHADHASCPLGISVVLAGLWRVPFEPFDSVELNFLSFKTALLVALISIKTVGDLQAFSLPWDPGLVMCPKFPLLPFRTRWWTCKHCPWRFSPCVAVSHLRFANLRGTHCCVL